jgi:hypothetical protein
MLAPLLNPCLFNIYHHRSWLRILHVQILYSIVCSVLYTRALGKTRDDIFEISKEMSPWYFGLAVFCLFEARVTKFDSATRPLPVQYTLYVH